MLAVNVRKVCNFLVSCYLFYFKFLFLSTRADKFIYPFKITLFGNCSLFTFLCQPVLFQRIPKLCLHPLHESDILDLGISSMSYFL